MPLQSERWRLQYWSAYVAAAIRFVRLALKVVVQNDGDFVNVILLYQRYILPMPIGCILPNFLPSYKTGTMKSPVVLHHTAVDDWTRLCSVYLHKLSLCKL